MACLGIQIASFGDQRTSIRGADSEEILRELRRSMTVIGDHRRRQRRSPRMCVDNLGDGAAVQATLRLARLDVNSGSRRKKLKASPQLDQLMKESVTEIVKNINEAPFLVQVFAEDMDRDRNLTSSASPVRLVMEKATPESWPFVTQRWEGDNSTPDGVILVEELGSADSELGTGKEETASSDSSCCTGGQRSPPSSARVWGLLVQSSGFSYPACYILKTCQVQCCFGWSTHFCLSKVDRFGEDVDFHLNKLWLQR